MSTARRSLVASAAGLMMVMSGLVGFASPAQAGWDPGGWGEAAPVAGVNDPVAADGCPIEAPNGKALFFASVRGPGGDNDIWMASRSTLADDFGEPVMLPAPVNTDAQEFCPTPLPSGALLFVSTRGGTDAYGTVACGMGDIYVTQRNWRNWGSGLSPATWAALRMVQTGRAWSTGLRWCALVQVRSCTSPPETRSVAAPKTSTSRS